MLVGATEHRRLLWSTKGQDLGQKVRGAVFFQPLHQIVVPAADAADGVDAANLIVEDRIDVSMDNLTSSVGLARRGSLLLLLLLVVVVVVLLILEHIFIIRQGRKTFDALCAGPIAGCPPRLLLVHTLMLLIVVVRIAAPAAPEVGGGC